MADETKQDTQAAQNAPAQDQPTPQVQEKTDPSVLVASSTTKSYTPLPSVPGVHIQQCSYMLPNRCQCWRASDYLVKKIEAVAASEGKDATTKETTYQLCARHAVIEQAVDAGRMQAETPTPIAPAPEATTDTPVAVFEDNPKPLPQLTLNPDGPKIPVGTVPPPEDKKPIAIPTTEATNPPVETKPVPAAEQKEQAK